MFRKEHQPSASGTEAESPSSAQNLRREAEGGWRGSSLGQIKVEERDYELLYAYALVTGQVAEELKVIAREIEGLFGVLDEDALLLQ